MSTRLEAYVDFEERTAAQSIANLRLLLRDLRCFESDYDLMRVTVEMYRKRLGELEEDLPSK